MLFRRTLLQLARPNGKNAISTAGNLTTPKISPKPVSSSLFTRYYSSGHGQLSKDQIKERVANVLFAFDKLAANTSLIKSKGDASFDSLKNASFAADLGLDSLDVVEVTMAVEEEFGLEIPDEVADNFNSPQDVIEYIYLKVGASESSANH